MHELSVALDLIDLALEEAERLGGVRVAALNVRVGPLSGVVSEALLSAFDLATAGTSLEGARLELTEEPITAWCAGCGIARTLPNAWSRVCSTCGRPLHEVLTGDALELTSMEVEDRAPPHR